MKRYANRLTEKKMKNRKFEQIEGQIVEAFFKGDEYDNVKKISKRAKIARSTFYSHHISAKNITKDYKSYLLTKYKKLVKKLLKNKYAQLKQIYLKTLIFIVKNQKSFKILVHSNDHSIFEEMLELLKTKIITVIYLPTYNDKLWQIYVAEITEVLWHWSEKGFKLTKLNTTLNDIMYLTKTAKARLSGLEVEE